MPSLDQLLLHVILLASLILKAGQKLGELPSSGSNSASGTSHSWANEYAYDHVLAWEPVALDGLLKA